MDGKELIAWLEATECSEDHWKEEVTFLENGHELLFYIGDEDGEYIKIYNDGKLSLGTYEGADPSIDTAKFTEAHCEQWSDLLFAYIRAAEIAGSKFQQDVLDAPSAYRTANGAVIPGGGDSVSGSEEDPVIKME